MATITKSIGTSSRDYSTITAWEADLDNTGIYTSGDDAVGECYNDSAFDEDFIIDGGGTVSLNSRTLTVASGEQHDGTEGSGVRIVLSANVNGPVIILNIVKTHVKLIEVDINGFYASGIQVGRLTITGETETVSRCIVHGCYTTGGLFYGIYGSSDRQTVVYNCIVYDFTVVASSTGLPSYAFGGLDTDSEFLNCTAYNYLRDDSRSDGESHGFYISTGTTVKNCIALDIDHTGGLSPACFSASGSNISYNISSDSTASGTGSLTNKTAANQFVSTVAGSEDLHLLSTADAVGAGVDLATTSIDINGSDRNALAATVWDIGAHQYASTASIGTSSRDYSTITLWEADLDDTTIYGAGANAVGECYNDSTFTANAYIDGGGTVGLNSVKLTAAAGNGHDGTAGTGAKFVSQAWYQTLSGGDNVRVTVSLLEIDYNSQRIGSLSGRGAGTGFGNTYNRLLLYNGDMHGSVFYYDFASMDISNNIVYNMSGSRGQYVVRTTSSATSYITNNTAYNIQGGYGISNGYYLRFGSTICKNCIAIDVVGNCFVYNGSPVAEYNISSDGTATGTGSQTNKSAANQFVSTLSGSEDLHIVETSDAFGAGVDLGTVVDGVQYDIDGQNRDTFVGTTWDIGADQVKTPASIGTSSRDYSTITAWEADLDDTSLYTSGDDAVGECYSDSDFSAGATINGGSTVGLNSITLTVHPDHRHDGTTTAGTRLVNVYTGISIISANTIVEWLAIKMLGTGNYSHQYAVEHQNASSNTTSRYIVGEGDQTTRNNGHGFGLTVMGGNTKSYNNIIYGWIQPNTTNATFYDHYGAGHEIYNNTIYNCYTGFYTTLRGSTLAKNIISVGNSNADYLRATNPGSCVGSNNLSSDSTATINGGSNHVTGAPVSKQFVSTLSGSEDLHLIFKSAAIDAGVDLGTTPDGVQYDINGKDRDTENSIWDIGAHEYGDNVVFGLLRV